MTQPRQGPVRVLHIITRMILGGAQENTLLSVEGLHKMPSYEVDLATGPALGEEGTLMERARKAGGELFVVEDLVRPIAPVKDLRSFFELKKLCNGYDIVHTHSSKAGILGRLAAAENKVPVVVHTIHGLPFHPYQNRLLYAFYALLERWAARKSHGMIAVGQVMKETAESAGIRCPAGIRVIYSGMELERFSPADKETMRARRRQEGLPREIPLIFKVGRLFDLKGHNFAVDALARLGDRDPAPHLVFVGDGPRREPLIEQARRLGVEDRLHFTGLVAPDTVGYWLSMADVVVHASLREGLPRVIPQALACGKPVVAFDVDGAREALSEGETGYLVEAEDVEGLACRVSDLLDSPSKAAEMGRKGREWVLQRFSAERMVQGISEFYQELLQRN